LTPSLPGPGGPETLKAEGNIFEKCFQNDRCLASYKMVSLDPRGESIWPGAGLPKTV